MNASGREQHHRWDISDVLARTDLASLLDECTQPATRIGPGRRWHCPVSGHDDHRASVSIFQDRHGHERWRCWSSDHRGDAIDLVAATTGRDRSDAIEWLATRAGMVPDRPLPPIPRKTTTPAPPAALVMDPAVERYVRVCASVLRGPQGAPVRDWLHNRGITDATIDANLIGADPSRKLLRRQRGLPYGTEIAATFPALDSAGHITYVQARYLDPDAAGRKYDNPSAALAPHPRLAFPALVEQPVANLLVVCEGMPDALTAAQAGFVAVGLLGAQTPDESVAERLAAYAQDRHLDIALVCDPDAAGRHVADVLTPLLRSAGTAPTVVIPPGGCDVNDWALTNPTWATDLIAASHPADRQPSPTTRSDRAVDVDF